MVAALEIPTPSEELMRRYDVAGPRYTSDPTVPEWKQDFGTAPYAERLWSGLARHLSLLLRAAWGAFADAGFRSIGMEHFALPENELYDGRGRREGGQLEVIPLGRLFVRDVAMVFDASPRRAERPRFSRTV